MDSRETIPQERRVALVETTQEFADRLDALYGLYLDATSGFKTKLLRQKRPSRKLLTKFQTGLNLIKL
jgi:hypothetical protein